MTDNTVYFLRVPKGMFAYVWEWKDQVYGEFAKVEYVFLFSTNTYVKINLN